MDLSDKILGTHAANQIREKTASIVLQIGRDRFTRADLAGVSCFNFLAAAHLSAALATLGAKSTKDVYDTIGPRMMALPGVGAVSLAVLGAAFESKGLGGGRPLETWYAQHRAADANREWLTFHTIKAQSADTKAAKKEARTKKARTLSRSTRAHQLRVDRHLARSGES